MYPTILRSLLFSAALAILALPLALPAATFRLDMAHTKVGFGVTHMVVSTTEGKFNKFGGSFDFNAGTLKNLKVAIKTASIDTNNARRDGHLRSKDFFAVKKYPQITFVQLGTVTGIRKGRWFMIPGKLTIRGVTRRVKLKTRLTGIIKLGKLTKAGFEARLVINRLHYNVKWNKALGAGRLALGDKVRIHIRGEADHK